MTVSIVTAWRNARELIAGYVRAATAADEVLIFDTGSDPPLRDDEFPPEFRLGTAPGFVAANNRGLELAQSDAVLMLNNDIVPLRADWLEPIRQALRPGRLIGADLRSDPHAVVDNRHHAYLDGWCLAGMRSDLLALGGLDETYDEPAYYSDNDLCLRAKASGFKLVEVGVGLRHIGNYTSKTMPLARERAAAANRERYQALARELVAPRLL